MQDKIEWYQEVLELEPGSKVFFPLARLFGQTGRYAEAVTVLRKGLEKHPEFIEARLLLIQLLRESGNADACAAELDAITHVFSAYPGFWQVWSEHGPSGDAAWALRFLATSFQTPGISLRDVLFSGLESMNAERAHVSADVVADTVLPKVGAGLPCAPEFAELAASLQPQISADSDFSEEQDESPEEVTLRTRSMAEILAEQGDVAGALEIYHEILSRTSSGPAADVLRERIATLTSFSGDVSAAAGKTVEEPAESDKMRTMLESLAQRLDARAHA